MNANDKGVLAVMDEMAETIYPHASAEHEAWHRRVTEARAAVAELVNRAQQTLERFEDDHDMRDLRTALARCGGAK